VEHLPSLLGREPCQVESLTATVRVLSVLNTGDYLIICIHNIMRSGLTPGSGGVITLGFACRGHDYLPRGLEVITILV